MQREIHRAPVDEQHQLGIFAVVAFDFFGKRRRPQQFPRLGRERQLASILQHPPVPLVVIPRFGSDESRRLAPLGVEFRHRHAIPMFREPAVAVEKPHAPLARIVERHAVGRPDAIRRQRFRIALKPQFVAQ